MMSFISLLRHGEVKGGACFRGRQDDPLSDLGWQQMHAACQEHDFWDVVITSPLQRCAAFAHSFAEQYNLPVEQDKRLAEIDFGDWEGCSASQLMEQHPDQLSNFWRDPINNPPPNGETLNHFQQRVISAWQQLNQRHVEKRILLVTHGGVIRMLLCHLQQRPLSSLMEQEVKYAALFHLLIEHDRIAHLFSSKDDVLAWLPKSGVLS
ncbi:MAG: alpha-ribazole phosphatase [Candidatus Thiodiazotropha sp.]|jgi:alpha-ribazole phosphatase